ncbi:hypothetical protein [Ruegeria sp. THAF33]|uniref:hypothetical protein n=1 Tax=Ruegeria sp. THAF33 TaxID=2587853 RepID=UPI0012A97F93|nr:hypothetical protein [Ruegeria sp. THAF33]QFT71770.1 hypothetical protein FIU92_01905 [Ruegeria sp. THAF33]
MTKTDATIRILIPLKVRKKNGRPTILPPTDYRPSGDHTQDPHILRAIGRAWGWRRRMKAGEFSTIQELAEAVGLAERHVSRQLRLAYLAPEVLKRLTCGRETSAVSLHCIASGASRVWHSIKGFFQAFAPFRTTTPPSGVSVRFDSDRTCFNPGAIHSRQLTENTPIFECVSI